MDTPKGKPGVVKGRGAVTNEAGRYERFQREAFDDGWDMPEDGERLATTVTHETARTIITRNDSPDLSFDRTINTYRGCEHGCIYCYARPNHAYVGLSPGKDFETRIFVKADAATLLEKELDAPEYQCEPIVMGGVTDVYQPSERRYGVTRAVLEVLWRRRHPVAIVTKSRLVLRDLDILAPMAAAGLAKVAVSVTTLEPKLARTLEPRAAAPHARLATIAGLAAAGVPTAVMAAPMIPSLNDHEMEAILEAAAAAGARQAGYIAVRLPLEITDLFREWLATHAPDRAGRVMALIKSMRGGREYDPAWGRRFVGQGAYARMLAGRFRRAAGRLGLDRPSFALDTAQFVRAPRPGESLPLF
jgi:DNA repair photolyase